MLFYEDVPHVVFSFRGTFVIRVIKTKMTSSILASVQSALIV